MESFYLHQTVAQYVSATILPIIEDFFDELTEEVFISEVTHEEQNSEVPNTEQFLTPYYNSANSFLAHNTEFGGRNDGPPGELTEDPFQSLSSEPRVNPAPPSVSTTQDDRPLHYYYELVSANLTNGEINFVTITLARSNGSRMITESERIQLEDILREAAYPVEVRVKILGAVIVDGEDILPRPLPGVLAGDSQGGTISPPND
ncbi:hypothetical protein FWD07_01750 [Candidatus Saccharibacteria bacterium]|nr:hypothetical protein [Candidatus Saccharibacteria bacterium]